MSVHKVTAKEILGGRSVVAFAGSKQAAALKKFLKRKQAEKASPADKEPTTPE